MFSDTCTFIVFEKNSRKIGYELTFSKFYSDLPFFLKAWFNCKKPCKKKSKQNKTKNKKQNKGTKALSQQF